MSLADVYRTQKKSKTMVWITTNLKVNIKQLMQHASVEIIRSFVGTINELFWPYRLGSFVKNKMRAFDKPMSAFVKRRFNSFGAKFQTIFVVSFFFIFTIYRVERRLYVKLID